MAHGWKKLVELRLPTAVQEQDHLQLEQLLFIRLCSSQKALATRSRDLLSPADAVELSAAGSGAGVRDVRLSSCEDSRNDLIISAAALATLPRSRP